MIHYDVLKGFDKNSKTLYYYEGDFWDYLPEDGVKLATWRHKNKVSDDTIVGKFYAQGKSISELDGFEERTESIMRKVNDFMVAYEKSGYDLNETELLHCLPDVLLKKYFELRIDATKYAIENSIDDNDVVYNIYDGIYPVIKSINGHTLTFDRENIEEEEDRERLAEILNGGPRRDTIEYDLFGTKTGRLSTKPGTFPILNVKKSLREQAIKPENDILVELDYNAAEIRAFLSLSGYIDEQPDFDIHEWNHRNVFKGAETRKDAKQQIFQLLYGSGTHYNEEVNKIYNKEKLIEKYYDDLKPRNYYGFEFDVNKDKFISYFIQSSFAFMFYKKIEELKRYIDNNMCHESEIRLLIHDAVVLDLAKEDVHEVEECENLLSDTDFGKFPVDVSVWNY